MKKILVQITDTEDKVVAQKMFNVERGQELEEEVTNFIKALSASQKPKKLGNISCSVLSKGEWKDINSLEEELAQEGFFDCFNYFE